MQYLINNDNKLKTTLELFACVELTNSEPIAMHSHMHLSENIACHSFSYE